MQDLLQQIDRENIPKHIAIIMDGNGRWAQQKGQPRVFGHQTGVDSVREIAEAAAEIGIKYLTLYTFSTENWQRPQDEVVALMSLLVQTIKGELPTLKKNRIRLHAIGDLGALPEETQKELQEAIALTEDHDRMTLVLALSYSAKWEITQAVKRIAKQVEKGDLDVNHINEDIIAKSLATHDIPDPELLIRTSGETRISNFLLWQIAYAELYFTPVFWPDFRKNNLYQAILNFQNRERRFGKTSAQVVTEK